MMMMVK